MKIPPEKTSCVISRNGMMDMAVVVLCTRQEIHSAIMSAEYEIRKTVIPMSTTIHGVNSPCAGILIPMIMQM